MSERFNHWDKNPYYNPEKAGVELVAVLEDDEPYEFDMVILVRDKETGALYAAHDSGCSCPTPFEELRDLGDMVEVRTISDLKALVSAHDYEYSSWTENDKFTFFNKAREALA